MAKHVITPAWQTSRGPIVQAHGCAAGVPVAGAKVFGETRQNLWSNPVGAANGATISSLEDGSISLSGDVTERTPISINTFILKPSTTYTISCDKVMSDLSDSGFYVQYKQGGQLTGFVATGNATSKTFETPSDLDGATCGVILQPGYSQGTYHVMLAEGSAADSWCPPGLTSVSELGVVVAGKNLRGSVTIGFNVSISDGQAYADINGALSELFAISGGNRYVASSLDLSNVYFNASFFDSNRSFMQSLPWGETVGARTFDAPDGARYMRVGMHHNGVAMSQGFADSMQVELGSTATAYEPPNVTTTPQDLAGHQLRSLPDGTRDVLTVDGSGAVSVEPWCYDFIFTGEESWIKSESRENSFYIISPGLPGFAIGSPSDSFVLCDKLPVVGTLAEYEKSTDSVLLYEGASLNVRHTASTLEEFKSWLASNNIHVVVAARAPFDAVPLDPITPPTVPAADATLWAASNVPCELEATTWTASGAEQGRQQAAMVKVAQQVRQQAETVAALAAKALEA